MLIERRCRSTGDWDLIFAQPKSIRLIVQWLVIQYLAVRCLVMRTQGFSACKRSKTSSASEWLEAGLHETANSGLVSGVHLYLRIFFFKNFWFKDYMRLKRQQHGNSINRVSTCSIRKEASNLSWNHTEDTAKSTRVISCKRLAITACPTPPVCKQITVRLQMPQNFLLRQQLLLLCNQWHTPFLETGQYGSKSSSRRSKAWVPALIALEGSDPRSLDTGVWKLQ